MSFKEIDVASLQIEAWDVERPQPAPNNNKIHTPESVSKLALSMDKMGQIQPIIVDCNDVIIAGHGRQQAALQLGWDKIKVIQLPVTDAEAKQMRLADNLSVNSNFDLEAIDTELRELMDMGLEHDDLLASVLDEKFLEIEQAVQNADDAFDAASLSKDINADVAAMSEENEKVIGDVEKGGTPVFKALGFKTVTPSQARIIAELIDWAMGETDISDPADALVAFARQVIND